VLVSYSYIATNCWLFFTNGKYERIFKALFCIAAFGGALGKVEVVWNLTDLVNAALLILNLVGLVWLTPFLKKQMAHA
jgi:AGCS family alanine or glycine:cation symporter